MTPTEQAFQMALHANIPVILWGSDGEGKSSFARATAESLGWGFATLIGSTMDPTDVGGLPIITGDTNNPGFAKIPHRIFKEACEYGEKGIPYLIMLDEMNCSPQAVLSTMLNLLTAREAGDTRLPSTVRFAAAANPPEIAVGAVDFQPPTCSRMIHLEYQLSEETWDTGMISGWAPVPPVSMPEDWEDARLGQARALLVAFRKRFPACFRTIPTAEHLNKPRSVPRTLSYLARVTACWEASGTNSDVLRLLAKGLVGPGVGGDFLNFYKTRELIPSPVEILASPMTVEIPEERGDLCYLMFCSVAAHVLQFPTVENWKAAWALIGRTEGTRAIAHSALAARTLAGLLRQQQGSKLRKHIPQEARIFTEIFREIGALSSN